MRGNDYNRTMRHHQLVEGEPAREALHDVVQSMGAISWMLRCTLLVAEEEGSCVHVEGVHKLIEQQCALLNGIHQELEAEKDRRDADNEAKGIVGQTKVPTEALIEHAHKLRVEFIESNTKAGVDPGLIGAALNLSNTDVQRVITRLRGEGSAPAKAASRRAEAR